MKTEIREARIDDTAAINRLSHALGYQQVPVSEAKERLKALLLSTKHKVRVLEKERQIIAWLHLFIAHRVASAPFAEIGGIAV